MGFRAIVECSAFTLCRILNRIPLAIYAIYAISIYTKFDSYIVIMHLPIFVFVIAICMYLICDGKRSFE